MEIYSFILRFVDSVTILPYMLTYMYWDTNIVHAIILLYIFIIVK
jgi:voltage-gated potassium channel